MELLNDHSNGNCALRKKSIHRYSLEADIVPCTTDRASVLFFAQDIKSYHNAHSDEKSNEAKLKQAENEKHKMEEKGSHKKSKTVDKHFDKVRMKIRCHVRRQISGVGYLSGEGYTLQLQVNYGPGKTTGENK